MAKKRVNRYPYVFRCPACRKTLRRDRDVRWMNSYCETAGRTVRIQRVQEPQS